MENLVDEALSIVEEFSSEPGMEFYFKHCREYYVVSILTTEEKENNMLIDILFPFSP